MIDVSDPFSSDNLEADPSQPQTLESPGTILKQARIQAGISQEAVADELNLVVAKVDALETDRYEKLASDVFAQGYLRRYSKLLGIDDDMVVERFRQWREANRTMPAESEQRSRPRVRPAPQWLIGALILVVVVAVAFFLFQNTDEAAEISVPESSQPQRPVEPAEPSGPEDPLWDEEESEVADFGSDWDDYDMDAPVELSRNGEAQFSTEAYPEQPEASVELDGGSISFNEEEVQSAHLSFFFSEECWIEVRDASGQILRAEVAHAGDSMSLEGEAPFAVMLGNARAAQAYYKGEPVVINTRPGNRTARLNIGP